MNKTCTKCTTNKEVSEFYKNASMRDGLESWCKSCSRECTNAYQKKNSAKILESSKKWRSKNPDKLKIFGRTYREKNKEKLKKLAKTDRIRYSSLKSAAKRRGLEFNLSLEEYENFLKQKCFYDGAELNELGYALDRVDNSKGYIKDNVVACCTKCNIAKNNMPQQSFLNMCLNIVKKHSAKILRKEKNTTNPEIIIERGHHE